MILPLDKILFLRQTGMYSLPFFGYFFFALLVLDALRIGLNHLKIALPISNLPLVSTIIAIGIAVLFMVYGTFHARKIHTVNYEITLNKHASGLLPQEGRLRIALISDTHIGLNVNRQWIANIVDIVNRTEPDIVIIVGDIFDNDIDSVRDLEGLVYELRRFNAPLGVFASQGNHDVDRISWRGALRGEASTVRIKDFLKNADIDLLLDEVVFVADSFYLVGRRDVSPIGSRHVRKTAADLAEGLVK